MRAIGRSQSCNEKKKMTHADVGEDSDAMRMIDVTDEYRQMLEDVAMKPKEMYAEQPPGPSQRLREELNKIDASCVTKKGGCDKRMCETINEDICIRKLNKYLRNKLRDLVDVVKGDDVWDCSAFSTPHCMYLSDYCQVDARGRCGPMAEANGEESDSYTDKFDEASLARAKARSKERKAKASAIPPPALAPEFPVAREGGSSGSGGANPAPPLQAASEQKESSDYETEPMTHEIAAGTYDVCTCGNLTELLREADAFANKSPENYISVFDQGIFETTTIKKLLTAKALIFKENLTWPWKAGRCKIA